MGKPVLLKFKDKLLCYASSFKTIQANYVKYWSSEQQTKPFPVQ